MARQPGTKTDLKTALYNPGLLTREALTRSFVARKQTLQMLEDELRRTSDHTAGQQHRLFVGPRGMGKTTLLLRLQYLVEDDRELSQKWCPVSFVEEKYGIGDLADFWLEILRGLPQTRLDTSPEKLAERIRTRPKADSDQIARAALEAVKNWSTQHNRHLLLLIDNLNEVFHHIGDERQLHQLRATLMESPWLKLIGFAAVYFEQLEKADAPFYEFFALENLQTISLEETQEILAHWSKLDDRPDLLERLTHRQGRVKNLHLLTGGNPRLVAVLYELFNEGPLQSTLGDIQTLVDRMTPYFKSQIDALPVQSRRVIDALAQRWEPVPTRLLAEDLRQPSNQVSAQLSRLSRDGWVTQRGPEGKHAQYQLADRFYNIYYLMRHSRSQLQRLKGFVSFLRVFFEDEDQKTLVGGEQDNAIGFPADNQEEKLVQARGLLLRPSVSPAALAHAEALHHTVSAQILNTAQTREIQALLHLAKKHWREALGVLDTLLQDADTVDQMEKALMDIAIKTAAQGKPQDVATLLIERGLEERWQPLVLALRLAHDPKEPQQHRVPLEILTVAQEIRDQIRRIELLPCH